MLSNASSRVHISRLEQMRTNLRGASVNLFGTENKILGEEIKNACTERYDLNNFVFQKGIGVGFDIAEINQDKLDILVSKPWANDGKNFSSRLWTQKEQMVSNLYNQLVRVCVGGSMKEAVETMMRYLDIEVENKMATARRLINTEMAYFTSEAQKMSYKELGCEQYEIVATLDGKTSHICQDMDGKVFDIKDFTAGITAPPFHPNCRSTTCPYFNDEFTEGETRAAKDRSGQTFKVPADMKYLDWRKEIEKRFRYYNNDLKHAKFAKTNNKDTKTYKRQSEDIMCEKLLGTANGLYIESTINITKNGVKTIDKSITDALKKLKFKNKKHLPQFVVISSDKSVGALGSFSATQNVIFINEALGDKSKVKKLQEGLACSDNILSTYVHELLHWKIAEDYISKHGKINKSTYKDYDKYCSEFAKQELDSLERKGYNTNDISERPVSRYINEKAEEVYIEHLTKLILGK